jgi:hypothetical protein
VIGPISPNAAISHTSSLILLMWTTAVLVTTGYYMAVFDRHLSAETGFWGITVAPITQLDVVKLYHKSIYIERPTPGRIVWIIQSFGRNSFFSQVI